MWLQPALPVNRRDASAWLKQNFPAAPPITFDSAKPLRLLVAGCGTGGEPVGFSRSINDIAIRAIDLSATSLAYAVRKTRELEVENIEYFQADLLELDSSFGPFDIVVCAGVLHHLSDPLSGWRVLRDLTKPGGSLLVALYSDSARRFIVEAQAFAAERGYSATPDSLRLLRHDIYRLEASMPWRRDVIGREEFYNLSMLRDLLFHVQEHRFTPPKIEQHIEELGLQFCGFTIGQEIEHLFKMKFGASADLLSLKQWSEFEPEYPDTFSGMYHFLCKRPS